MMKMQPILSYVLLTVYLVVMVHSMVPHHHHEKSFENKCFQEISCVHMAEHSSLCADSSCNHPDEQVPCHFEVKPVPGKSLVLSSYAILAVVLQQFHVPEEEQCQWPQSLVPHIQEPYLQTFGLRGPPALV